MNLLYLIAMYGTEYLGNLIHRELGHEFQNAGHSFSVFALASAQERRSAPADTLEENVAVHRALAAGKFAPNLVNAAAKPFFHYERFGMGWWTLKRYLGQHPEHQIILAEGAYPFAAMADLASRKQKLVITVAGGDFINSRAMNYGYGRFRVARSLMRRAFARADAIRVTTPLVRDQVIALGASAKKITLIPRNIAAYCFPPADIPLETFRATQRAALDARYHFENAKVIIAAGRLLPIKGFDILIRALPDIQTRAGDARLLLVGPNRVDVQYGDYQNHLQALARVGNVQDKIIFTGALPHPEMRALLAAADVIAVPSILEGMNKIVVEGAAVGTPSVVTRTAGISDLMQNVGAIVEPNDVSALAASLGALLNNPAQRALLGKRGVSWAEQFSSSRIAAQLIALCEKTLH